MANLSLRHSRKQGHPRVNGAGAELPDRYSEYGTAADIHADESAADVDAPECRTATLTEHSTLANDERPARLSPRGSSRSFDFPCCLRPLDDATARDQADQHDHDRDDEQQMDQPARDVKHAEAENPQNEENDRKCPKHCRSPRSRVSGTSFS